MIVEKIRKSLRISTDKTDDEIEDLISACKLDLLMRGIKNIDEGEPLIFQAIKLYCKANYGLDNKDSEKYTKAYEGLRDSISLCGDYNVE